MVEVVIPKRYMIASDDLCRSPVEAKTYDRACEIAKEMARSNPNVRVHVLATVDVVHFKVTGPTWEEPNDS